VKERGKGVKNLYEDRHRDKRKGHAAYTKISEKKRPFSGGKRGERKSGLFSDKEATSPSNYGGEKRVFKKRF